MKLKKIFITLSIFLFLILLAGRTIAMSYFENVGSNTRDSNYICFKCKKWTTEQHLKLLLQYIKTNM